MKTDVVIVGSGVSALTAAAILSKKGKQVVVVEKQSSFGGSLRQFKRRKIPFDVGFHYTGCLGEGEILDKLWRYCGVRSRLGAIPLGEHGYDHFQFDDLTRPVRGYFSYDRLAEELISCFPHEKSGIRTYFETIQEICREVPFYNLDQPLTSFLRGYKARPSSLSHFLDTHMNDRHLKAVLAAPGFLYGVPTKMASLEVHALVAHGYYLGAYTIDGGGQVIVDAFLQTLQEQGVVLLSDHGVEAIHAADGKITGVDIAGKEPIQCSQVVYTGHPASLIDLIPPGIFRPAYRSRLQELRNSLSMFAVFGEAERPLEILNGPLNYYSLPGTSNVLPVCGDIDRRLRPMMMTAARPPSDEVLQQGQNGIILLRLGYWQDVERFSHTVPGNRPAEYEWYKNEIATEMTGRAERMWGNLVGTIEPLAVGSPLTFRDALNAPEGCAYGAMHCLDQYNPDVRTRLPGLLLAGQSTLMTGVVGASISGLVAAGEILGLEPLWEELKGWH